MFFAIEPGREEERPVSSSIAYGESGYTFSLPVWAASGSESLQLGESPFGRVLPSSDTAKKKLSSLSALSADSEAQASPRAGAEPNLSLPGILFTSRYAKIGRAMIFSER